MKSIMIIGFCVVLGACAPTGGGGAQRVGGAGEAEVTWSEVPGVTHKALPMGSELVAKVDGREVVAVTQWRIYDPTKDAGVKQWQGNEGGSLPVYVMDSLVLAVDGKGVSLPKSSYRNLGAMMVSASVAPAISISQHEKKLRLMVDGRKGGLGWTASYVFDPAAGKLLSHSETPGS